MHHYAWAQGPTTIQVHGLAPFAFTYVNPSGDVAVEQRYIAGLGAQLRHQAYYKSAVRISHMARLVLAH